MSVTLDVIGTEALIKALTAVGPRGDVALTDALYLEAEDIMRASKQIVPVHWGHLRSSGMVEPPAAGSGVVVLGYGGPSAPYAIYVHENTAAKHQPPTQAKYLEMPARMATAGMGDRLAYRIRRTLGPGV